MVSVSAWLEQREEGQLILVARIYIPRDFHRPNNAIHLRLCWPREKGEVAEPKISGSFAGTTLGHARGNLSSISASLLGVITQEGGVTSEEITQYPATQIYDELEGLTIRLSGFVYSPQIRAAYYKVVISIKNPVGFGEISYFGWKAEDDQEYAEVKIDSSQVWDDAISRILPATYVCYRGNTGLLKTLDEMLSTDEKLHALVLHGPGGIGKTAMLRSILSSLETNPWSLRLGFSAKGKSYSVIEGGIIRKYEEVIARDIYGYLTKSLNIRWDGSDIDRAHMQIKTRLEKEKRTILIADNLETVCEFEYTMSLLLGLVGSPPAGLLVATTRELPPDWELKRGKMSNCRIHTQELVRLDDASIRNILIDTYFGLFGASAPSIPNADLEQLVTKCDGHPLSAQFFANVYSSLGRKLIILNKSRNELLAYCFDVQWEKLNETEQKTLHHLCIMETKQIAENELESILSSIYGFLGSKAALDNLRRLSFLETSYSDNSRFYSLHSMVQEYVENRHS